MSKDTEKVTLVYTSNNRVENGEWVPVTLPTWISNEIHKEGSQINQAFHSLRGPSVRVTVTLESINPVNQ